jgi:hypothetical protein
MPQVTKELIFPRAVTTVDKINLTSLAIALGTLSEDKGLKEIAQVMVNSLYAKSRIRAHKRANAVLALLESHR